MTTDEIIAEVARQKGMTLSEVEKEIREVVREAMTSPDPRTQKLWKQIAPDGKEPSLDFLLDYLATLARKRMGS